MMTDNDDDRLYRSFINPIAMSAALGSWLVLAGIIMLIYALSVS